MPKEFKSYFKEGMPPKKEKKPLKRTRIKYKKKDTKQVDTFTEIAETREWYCFVSGIKLWQLTATSFAHVLPKALNKYPLMKTDPRNIVLLSDECHRLWDFGSREELKSKPEWEKMFRLEAELKEIYKTLKK
ncbi:MAG: HNH endonuclease [Melioribacteraceae bacterium]